VKAEHVNAFLVPSVQVLQQMARLQVHVGKASRPSRALAGDGLSIIIGIQGRLCGSVILTSSREVAWALASRIMKEEISPDAQEDVAAVLSELANIIVGNATGYLKNLGINERISPPMVVMGSEVSFDFSEGAEIISVPLDTELGSAKIIVSLAGDKP
jgi:chemotaxis protein CheX